MKIKNSQYCKKLAEALKNVFSKSLVECVLFCIAAVLLITDNFMEGAFSGSGNLYHLLLTDLALWMITFALLSYTINQFIKNKHRWVYYTMIPISALVFSAISILYFQIKETPFFDEIIYAGVLILAILAALVSKGKLDNRSIFLDTCQKLFALLVAGILSLIILALCELIMASVNYLFDANIPYYGYGTINIISLVAIAPILFFALDGTFSIENHFQHKLNKILHNYILSPAAVLYLVFLYAYIIKILIIGQLPHGEISYIVAAFMAFVFSCHLFDNSFSTPLVSKFYRYLHILVLPPLVLAWIGAIKRVSAYGLTEWRIFMLAMLILLSIYVLSLFFRKFKYHLSLAIAIAALMCALLTLIEPINIKNLAINSIQNRCEQMIESYHLLDGDRVNIGNCNAMDSTDREELWDLLVALNYRTNLNPSMSNLKEVVENVQFCPNLNFTSVDSYFRNPYTSFNIADYKKITWLSNVYCCDTNLTIKFSDDSTQDITIEYSDIDKYIHSIVGEEIPDTLPEKAYIYCFDNKAIILEKYTFENNHIKEVYLNKYMLFEK